MPALLELFEILGPELVRGIAEGAQIYQRLQAGDESAVDQAKDWLGVTGEVAAAIAAWEASKTQ